ncbi:hypothetical protein [Paraliobacillus sp. JSM ZJ581]
MGKNLVPLPSGIKDGVERWERRSGGGFGEIPTKLQVHIFVFE